MCIFLATFSCLTPAKTVTLPEKAIGSPSNVTIEFWSHSHLLTGVSPYQSWLP